MRRGLPIVGPPPTLAARLEAIRVRLVDLEPAAARIEFETPDDAELLKGTISLCPECLVHVPALVFAREGSVWMKKRCPAHGLSSAVVENDRRYFLLSNRDRWGRRYADGPV